MNNRLRDPVPNRRYTSNTYTYQDCGTKGCKNTQPNCLSSVRGWGDIFQSNFFFLLLQKPPIPVLFPDRYFRSSVLETSFLRLLYRISNLSSVPTSSLLVYNSSVFLHSISSPSSDSNFARKDYLQKVIKIRWDFRRFTPTLFAGRLTHFIWNLPRVISYKSFVYYLGSELWVRIEWGFRQTWHTKHRETWRWNLPLK